MTPVAGAATEYPEWAHVHDPAAGATASAVADEQVRFESTRPKPAEVVATALRLAQRLPVPHHPVFLESVGRRLSRRGSTGPENRQAALLFVRAREVEREHGLPVDDGSWLRSHLEFARCGAFPPAALAPFVAGLRSRFAPADALDAFVEFAVARVLGGAPPWTQLPKQVAALATAAGRDAVAEQHRVIEPLLEHGWLREAPAGLWKEWRPAIIALAAAQPTTRGALLDMFPFADDIDGWWIDLLDECGALDAVTDEAEPGSRHGAAGWLSRTIAHPFADTTRMKRSADSRDPGTACQVMELIPRMSRKLIADGDPVVMRWTPFHDVDVRVLEACLANGIPVEPPARDVRLDLRRWLQERSWDEDIPAIVAHPAFRRLLPEGRPPEVIAPPGWPGVVTAPRMHVHREMNDLVYGFFDFRGLTVREVAIGLERVTSLWRSGIERPGDTVDDISGPARRMLRGCGVLVGRIGGVAMRAVSPATPPEHREVLLAFLEMWAATPLAEHSTLLRRGVVQGDWSEVVTASGFAVRTSWLANGRGFVELQVGAEPVPPIGDVIEVAAVEHRWGAPAGLLELVRLAREHGPVPVDREAAELLGSITDLSPVAAALALAGIPGSNHVTMPSPASYRLSALSIGPTQARRALEELRFLTPEQRLDLLAEALPADPAELWQPDGMREVARRIAATWPRVVSRSPSNP